METQLPTAEPSAASNDVVKKPNGNGANSPEKLSRRNKRPATYIPGSGKTYITDNGLVWRILGDYWYQYIKPAQPPGAESPDFDDYDKPLYLSANLVFERSLNDRGTWGRGPLLATVPNLRLVSEATERQMPRFLYRVSHSDSGGSSELDHFQSQSLVGGLGRVDMTTCSRDEIRRSLELHFKNARSSGRHEFYSPWISFTSSFLFCKFWAFRNKAKGQQNVRIHIVDTNEIRSPALIVHGYTIAKAYKVGAKPAPGYTGCELPGPIYRQRLASSYSEYLVWNEIFVDSDLTSLDEILAIAWNPGEKPKVYPPLRDLFLESHFHKSTNAVFKLVAPCNLRDKLYGTANRTDWRKNHVKWGRFFGPRDTSENRVPGIERIPLDAKVFEAFMKIARCVRAKFQLEMLVGMLAIRTRYIFQDTIVDEIVRRCKNHELPYEPVYYGIAPTTATLIEVKHQQEMMMQCAEGIGICIHLGNDRPARNLMILECVGPSGLAKTIDANLTQPLTPTDNDDYEEKEDDNEDIDARLKTLDAGPRRRGDCNDHVTIEKRRSQCIDEAMSRIGKRVRPNSSTAAPIVEVLISENLAIGAQVTHAVAPPTRRDTNNTSFESDMATMQPLAVVSSAEESSSGVIESEFMEEPDRIAGSMKSDRQSGDTEDVNYWNELCARMESINEDVKL